MYHSNKAKFISSIHGTDPADDSNYDHDTPLGSAEVEIGKLLEECNEDGEEKYTTRKSSLILKRSLTLDHGSGSPSI